MFAHPIRIFLILAAICLSVIASQAKEPNQSGGFVAHGHDVVAYFLEDKPVKGDPAFAASHDGGTYLFSSAENLAAFKADPAKYAPQFGGYCAYAVSQGYTADVDPEAYSVRNGKLYLNYNKAVRSKWLGNVDAYIADGEKNWPNL